MKHVLTLLVGFVLGGTTMYGVFLLAIRSPPTPKLRPPTAIRVTLHPWEAVGIGRAECESVDIPPEKLDYAYRLLMPEQYFGTVHEFITPIVAEAAISHEDGEGTFVLVRDHGHNPAVVTVDGRNYFYARNDPDVRAGAVQLIRLVNEVAHKKKAIRQPGRRMQFRVEDSNSSPISTQLACRFLGVRRFPSGLDR